jgi:hypothetical protein
MRKFFFVLLGLGSYPVPVFAASRYAVLVGVGDYDPNTEVVGVVQLPVVIRSYETEGSSA